MDDGGTLDFEDLMDTGDEFPGFEIAKFTPANDNQGNDDGVLRTPEHEKDDEDYLNESRNNHKVKDDVSDKEEITAEVNSVEDIVNSIEGVCPDDVTKNRDNAINDEPSDKSEKTLEKDDVEMVMLDESGDNKPDVQIEEKNEEHKEAEAPIVNHDETEDIIEITEDNSNTEDKEEEHEPAQKKKKLFLKPPEKKMSLMGSLKKKTKEVDDDDVEITNCEDSNRVTPDKEDSIDDPVIIENGDDDGEMEERKNEEKDTEKDGKNENSGEEEEEEPHQQSFLSFLNLKPGASKPKKNDEIEKEETLQKEFYSRKRLRTRKKVSYCEDVQQDDDDEYNVDEEEDEDDADHQIDYRRGGNRNNNKVRRNSGSANYTNALQNLLPGVDLSCLQRKPVQISPNANNLASTPLIMEGLKAQSNIKGLFECGLCGVFFNTAAQFLTHQQALHAGQKKNGRSAMETFRCEVCGFVLTNRFAYLEHKKMKHNKSGTVYSCSKCKINKFTDLTALQKHQQACGVPFCSTCGATFKAWVDVADHRRKAHPPVTPTRQWLNCGNKLCNFKCVTQHEMRQHIQTKHAIGETFTCNAPRCTLMFSSREKLTEHKKEAHASEFIVQYQCMECKNCFSSKTLLAEHQYLHTLEKLRKCDLCLRQFTNVNDLRKHKDVHAVKGTSRCQACLRWCFDKIELVNHVCAQKRRNIGIRLYFCDVCHKDFRSDEKMFLHRKEHKNFFQCGICLSEFHKESEYFTHREIHSKFTCKECCEELDEKDVEMHAKAHKYYIKLEDIENNGKNEKAMFLCPNLFNAIQA
ncbi:zinc finger protein 37-like [Ruditapes philippinarum]|uniref:zinc finger protein 37-like n=1 Tax=Ruditapes philippinarum TaxID=129788 RepID=UPI00295B3BAC|nr:zinc finger protein 37-like [Ruditapes philippinarum]